MKSLSQTFSVPYHYQILFSEGIFSSSNITLADLLKRDQATSPRKCLFVMDDGVDQAHPGLKDAIYDYQHQHADTMAISEEIMVVPGGETCKNEERFLQEILKKTDSGKICRHSYVIAIGGGALLDMVGFAAAIAHRGVRLIRIPTTVLSQNDSGVGVKNGINAFGKKNFLGSFKPPYAVINDADFLDTLDMRDWRSGISEAIKVALIKDASFFRTIQKGADKLINRDKEAMKSLIYRCAEMHLEHIAGGDPFEAGSSRPLDFGHWAAHKLEHLTDYRLRHGEAVAIGIALDVSYSYLKGFLPEEDWKVIIDLLDTLGFELWVPELQEHIEDPEHPHCVLRGIEEFREHLGGKLTVMLIDRIGHGFNVHELDRSLFIQAAHLLRERQTLKLTRRL